MSTADVDTTESFAAEVPILRLLITPAGSEPLPDFWDEAQALFEQAEDKSEAEAYAEAAELFLQAATLLGGDAGEAYADSTLDARRACYANAWHCFVAAEQTKQGRKALQKAAAGDPALQAHIEALIAAD